MAPAQSFVGQKNRRSCGDALLIPSCFWGDRIRFRRLPEFPCGEKERKIFMNVAMISSWHVHARGYAEELQKQPNVTITAVWDEDPQAGEAWAKELGCKYCPDYDAILADPTIDGIAMVAKTVDHGDMLLKAANAGKHIFTEKVLTITSKEAYLIRDAVKKNNVVLTISYPHECRSEVQFAKQMADKGALGQITYARIRNVHDGSSAGWLPPHFYDASQCGGGAMMDLGAHPMYLLNWFLGKPSTVQSCFTKVTGKAVEDNAVSVLSYPNGAIGVSETGFVSQDNPFTLELSGTKGALMVHGHSVSYANDETDHKWVEVTDLPEKWPAPIEQWVGAITEGKKNHLDIDAAVALTETMEGAYQAYESKGTYCFQDQGEVDEFQPVITY